MKQIKSIDDQTKSQNQKLQALNTQLIVDKNNLIADNEALKADIDELNKKIQLLTNDNRYLNQPETLKLSFNKFLILIKILLLIINYFIKLFFYNTAEIFKFYLL